MIANASYTTGVIANDAEFRIRGKWFSDQMTIAGWAKTSDTGQIDWATTTKSASVATVSGYEIRKSNDGLTDIYIKVEYGTGTTATSLGMWITTGTGSNGSGTLTGLLGTRLVLNSTAAPTACNDYLSGTAGRLCLAYNVISAVAQASTWFVLQRTTDASGADTSDGFVLCGSSGITLKNQYTSFGSGVVAQRAGIGWMLDGAAPLPASLASVPVFPVYVAVNTAFQLMRDLVSIPSTYASGGAMQTLSLLGSNRTLIGVYAGGAPVDGGTASAVPLTICMRYE